MVRRVVAGVLVAFMVLVMAVTPLSAVTQAGYFDFWLPASFPGPSPHVVLFDDTGLVSAFAPSSSGTGTQGVEPSSGMTRTLEVWWLGGCADKLIELHFFASGDVDVIRERTEQGGCPLDIGLIRSFRLDLRAPVDAGKVVLSGGDLCTDICDP